MLLPAISSPSGVLATPPLCTMSLMLQIPLCMLRNSAICLHLAALQPAGTGINLIPFYWGTLQIGNRGLWKDQDVQGPFFPPTFYISTQRFEKEEDLAGRESAEDKL